LRLNRGVNSWLLKLWSPTCGVWRRLRRDQEILMSNLREQEALKQRELEDRLRLEAQARLQEEQLRAEAEKKLAELQSRLVAQERQKSIEVEAALDASRRLQEELREKLRQQERSQEARETSAKAHAHLEELRASHLEEITSLLAEQKRTFAQSTAEERACTLEQVQNAHRKEMALWEERREAQESIHCKEVEHLRDSLSKLSTQLQAPAILPNPC
jgi:colicin import membrane protein